MRLAVDSTLDSSTLLHIHNAASHGFKGYIRICCILAVEVMKDNIFYKNVYVFLFFRRGLKLLCCVRQTEVGRQDRLPYWPITFSLDHSTLCYLQDPLNTSLTSRLGSLDRRPLRVTAPGGAFSLTALALTLAFTYPNWLNCHGHLHILFHNAHFRLDHVIFCLFAQVHIWLTARLRVNT